MFNKINYFIGGLIFLFSTAAYADPGIFLSESTVKAKVGNVVSVDLLMSDFPVTEGGGVEINYDPALVQVNSVDVDDSVWNFAHRGGVINNTTGTVSDILFSSYQGVSGDVKIATIEIEFVGKGQGEIVLGESVNNPFAGGGQKIAVTFTATSIRVRK